MQETAPQASEGLRKTAYLGAQDSAHEAAQEIAHLNTENVETGNGNRDVVSASEPSSVKNAKRDTRQPRTRKTRLSQDWRLSEPNLSFAIQCGLSADAVPREAIKFKNYYIGK
ncbi:MAG: hypothetical protein WA441_06075, partial [Methyloceanibacter sp.]